MSSQARQSFDNNRGDIQRLLDIHSRIGGTGPGRRHDVEVLNKAGVVLLTAFWEAYCEDLAAEALEHMIATGADAACVPMELRKLVAKELKKQGAHELAAWDLADNGWRQLLQARLASLQQERNRSLNTPKAAQINSLFHEAIGLPDVSAAWSWHRMTSQRAQEKLDHYVTLRGDVAHRGAAAAGVSKGQVTAYYNHVKRLVGKTGGRVNTFVRTATGTPLW